MNKTYDSKNIKILSNLNFDWSLIEILAIEHSKPVEWVRRGFESCRLAGVDPQYFVDRYILKKDIPRNAGVDDIYRERLKALR